MRLRTIADLCFRFLAAAGLALAATSASAFAGTPSAAHGRSGSPTILRRHATGAPLVRCACIGTSCRIKNTVPGAREFSGGRFRAMHADESTSDTEYPQVVQSGKAVLFTNFPAQDHGQFFFLRKYLTNDGLDVTWDTNTGTS